MRNIWKWAGGAASAPVLACVSLLEDERLALNRRPALRALLFVAIGVAFEVALALDGQMSQEAATTLSKR